MGLDCCAAVCEVRITAKLFPLVACFPVATNLVVASAPRGIGPRSPRLVILDPPSRAGSRWMEASTCCRPWAAKAGPEAEPCSCTATAADELGRAVVSWWRPFLV